MAKKKFPYSMFQVTPSLNVKEIVLVGKAIQRGWSDREYERTDYAADEKGKHHYLRPLFETREVAVAQAKTTLAEQEARHVKMGENLAKRRANVEKLDDAKSVKAVKSAKA